MFEPCLGPAIPVRAMCLNAVTTFTVRTIYTTIVVQPSRRWFAPLVRSKIVDTRTGCAFIVPRAQFTVAYSVFTKVCVHNSFLQFNRGFVTNLTSSAMAICIAGLTHNTIAVLLAVLA